MEIDFIRKLWEAEYDKLRNKLILIDKKYKCLPEIEIKIVNEDSSEILFENITVGTCKRKGK